VDDGLTHPLVRPSIAAEQIQDWTVAHGRARVGTALTRTAATLDDAANVTRELVFVSDLQKSNFSDSAHAAFDGLSRLTVVPVGDRRFANVALTSARLVSSVIEVDQPLVVEATIRNYGSEPVANWGLSVFINDERVAQTTVSLDGSQEATVPVSFTPAARGWLSGRLSLEDDAFAYDNDRYFTVLVPEVRRILLVKGEGRRVDFVKLALSTQLQDGRRLFDVTEVDEASVSGIFSGTYDAVVLIGARTMAPGLVTALSTFVQDGGGALIFAGEEAGDGAYAPLLAALSAGNFSGLAEASPGAALTTLDDLDIEHPLFRSVFDNAAESGSNVERPTIDRLVRYRPGPGDEQTILSTTIGLPMLQEIRSGEGRVLLAPFLPESDWTDLPVRGLFVPLLFRSMYYLTTRLDSFEPSNLDGQDVAFRIPGAADVGQLRIVSRTGQEWIPEQRASGRGLRFSLPTTLRDPGVYDVKDGDRLVQRFAVNPVSAESDLDRLPPDEAAALLHASTGVDPVVMNLASDGVATAERIRELETGVEIWNVFLAVALLLLIAEMLIAARWRPAFDSGAPA